MEIDCFACSGDDGAAVSEEADAVSVGSAVQLVDSSMIPVDVMLWQCYQTDGKCGWCANDCNGNDIEAMAMVVHKSDKINQNHSQVRMCSLLRLFGGRVEFAKESLNTFPTYEIELLKKLRII